MALSRELPLGKNAAVLVIDAQNYCWEQGKGIWAGAEAGAPSPYYWEQVEAATANIASILAGLAAAGQDGLDRRLELPPPKAPDAARLPTSLPEALDALKADGVLAAALGDDLLEWFDLVKRAELAHVDAAKATFLEAGQTDDDATQSAWNDLYFAFL